MKDVSILVVVSRKKKRVIYTNGRCSNNSAHKHLHVALMRSKGCDAERKKT
jgi:hypothetical protein